MKIKKIQLSKGFKRFFDLTIDLGNEPKKIIALIGPNGCGKSSVFDGLLLSVQRYGNIVGGKNYKEEDYYILDDSYVFHHDNIDVEFIEGSFREIVNKKRENKKENTIFSYRSPYRYNNNLKVKKIEAIEDIKDNSYGASTAIDIDDKMVQNYKRLNIKYSNYLHKNDCKPSEAKAKIIGDINISLKNCLELEIDNIGNIEENKGTLYFKKDDHPSPFEFNVLSSGEKEVVDILLDLYLRQDEYDDTIYIIDEPELHINSSIQRKLLIEINKLINNNCQLWIATHSIGFLRALQEDLKEESQIIQFKEGVNWASQPQVLTPIINTRAQWKELFKTALDDLTELVSPKRIIYCEGKDKAGAGGLEQGFDAKVYNNIFSKNYHDTLFISSGGNTELDQRSEIALAILSKVFTEVEILVLKDRDVSSGKSNNEDDRQLYLKTNLENHRMLKRFELENYLYDKKVLKKFCDVNGKHFNINAYDNLVKDIVNQNLKDETGKIKNFCNITTSINPEKFKLQLSELISEDMDVYKELEQIIFHRK